MGHYVVNASAVHAASATAIWNVLADVSTWSDWGPYTASHLEDDDHDGGVGAVRVYAVGPSRSREEVVVFDAPRRFGYRILSGFPARDYYGEVTLNPLDGGGTRVDWRAEFDGKPRGTGWLMRILLVPYLRFLVNKTGRVAQRRAAGS